MIKILVHHPLPSDGTSFYRGFGPLNALEKQYPGEIEITDCSMEVSWPLIMRYDILFMQRPASKWQVDFIRMAKAYGVPVWVDWDDHYLDIPVTNNRKEFYSPFNDDMIKWIIRNADMVTVSTDHLKEVFSQYGPKKIMTIRNGIDTDLFNPHLWKRYKSDNLILWRGSDTHNADFEFYKKEILELMDETPDYVWGFFGYFPQWAVDHLPSHRIRLYANDGVIEYVQTLLHLKPKLVYVILEDIPFNHAKSNIAYLEATYAGAVVVCPEWPEWKDLPAFHYTGRENFKQYFHAALSVGDEFVEKATQHVTKNYSLSKLNYLRFGIAKTITSHQELPPVTLPEPFTNEEFFNYNKEHGWTQENPDWVRGQDEISKYLLEIVKAQTVFDLGCGTGGLLESLIKKNVVCMGVDSNPLNKEFFDKRNPGNEHRFLCDMAQNVAPGNHFDVVFCCEVFEHIPDEINERILAIWREKCSFFVFSSTPYTTTPSFDNSWGHINVKPTDHWITFFEQRGFKLVQRLDYPTKWSLLFIACPKI